ncbi:unnamed protein product [Psylliodes chrysocephalus]|uniref:Mitochondrial inner membrane protein Mpv17 n=1 Tax=Psylliodes chrysocephalus TaxID=3402493 RepID=A0A9P0D4P6_9CUCU|nr:unnamed protein product [Psylliodes chrysocephala]
MSSLNKIYQRMVRDHLLIVQSVQASCLMTIGDIIAQKVIEKKSEIELKRTARFTVLGLFLVGPSVATWFKFLSNTVGDKDKNAAIKKVVLDQLFFAPGFLPIFLVALNTIKGNSWQNTKDDIKDKYLDIMKANYKLWPVAQFVNFKFVPFQYQVLMNQSVAIFWNTYLSWKTTQSMIKTK